MSLALHKHKVEELLGNIRSTRIRLGEMSDIENINLIIDEIRRGGWRLKIEAYSSPVERTSNGKRLLKTPRKEWRYVAWFVRGDEKVWYYNNKADSKAYAMDMQSKSDPEPRD